MPATTYFGLLGCWILGLALVLRGIRVERISRAAPRVAVGLAVGIALFLPLGDLSAVAYLRSFTGDLSVSTLFLAGVGCIDRIRGRQPADGRELQVLLWVLVCAGTFLYPLALGLTPFDPYALGYGSTALASLLLIGSLVAWLTKSNVVVLVVILSVLAYLLGGYETRNLWDYLLDPLASGYALVRLLRLQFKQGGSKPTGRHEPAPQAFGSGPP